jgi:hypothetical protein
VSQYVKACVDHVGGRVPEPVDDGPEVRGGRIGRRCRVAGLGEGEQVTTLVHVQAQRVGDRGDHLGRGVNHAALLEPRVPGDTDVGKLSDLLGLKHVRSFDRTEIGCHLSGTGPALVLVHGTAADDTRWAPVAPALAERFAVVAIDRRGRGASSDAHAERSPACAVRTALADQTPDRPASACRAAAPGRLAVGQGGTC